MDSMSIGNVAAILHQIEKDRLTLLRTVWIYTNLGDIEPQKEPDREF